MIFIVLFISIALIFLSGRYEGLMELSSHGKLSKVKNQSETWQNKWGWFDSRYNYKDNFFILSWKDVLVSDYGNKDFYIRKTEKRKLWYYLWVFTPEYIEAFPYSSSILVAFTDYWHLVKLKRGVLMYLSLILSHLIPCFILLYTELPFNALDVVIHVSAVTLMLSFYKLGWWLTYRTK